MNKYRYILFWIKSSRGTNSKSVYKFPKEATKDFIKQKLEQWCSCFGAWQVSENFVSYGWKSVKMLPRRELEKKYKVICDRKSRVTEQFNVLAAMLNPHEVK